MVEPERASARRSRGRRRIPRSAAVVVAVGLAAVACGSGAEVSSTSSAPAASEASTSTPGTAAVLAEPTAPAGDAAPGATSGAPGGPTTTEAGERPSTTAPPEPAVLPIGTVQLGLVDTSRPTVSRGTTLSSNRSLPTTVTYPTGPGGPWPLLVFAHGYRLGPPGYARLVAVLTAAGYVVAAPSFPLADESVAGANVDRGDLPNQPDDLSFVIDQVLGASSDPSSPLAGRVDGSRVGAVGHSDGADTVLDLGYHPARVDPRVRAVVALAPDAVVAAGSATGGATPLLLEHGDADDVVPFSESRSVFANVTARRYLLTLVGGGHLPPVAETTGWTPVLDATVTAFLDRYVAGRTVDDAAVTAPASGSAVARIDVAG